MRVARACARAMCVHVHVRACDVCVRVCVRVRACARARVRACVHACGMCVCVRVRVRVCVWCVCACARIVHSSEILRSVVTNVLAAFSADLLNVA
jgi:hypothetical protein